MAWILSDQFSLDAIRGGCLSCGNDRPRTRPQGVERIVKLDYTDEFNGAAEFCESCIEEVAKDLGMVPGAKFKKSEEAKKVLVTEVLTLKKELEDAQATIRTLTGELHRAQNETVSA
jgi:hypothetical protein